MTTIPMLGIRLFDPEHTTHFLKQRFMTHLETLRTRAKSVSPDAAEDLPVKSFKFGDLSEADMRMALGVRLNRQLSRTGITIEGVRYHSEALVHQHLSLGDHDVEVRWDHTDIGAVSVRLESGWEEVRTVHRTGPDGSPFDGLSAAEWNAVMRALRAGEPSLYEDHPQGSANRHRHGGPHLSDQRIL